MSFKGPDELEKKRWPYLVLVKEVLSHGKREISKVK